MSHGAVNHPLEACGRLRLAMRIGHQARELVVEIGHELVAQHIEIDRAGAHHRRRVAVVDQRQQQMFERGIFVAALIGILQRAP